MKQKYLLKKNTRYHESLQWGHNEALLSSVCPGNSPLSMQNSVLFPRKPEAVSLADHYFSFLLQFIITNVAQPCSQCFILSRMLTIERRGYLLLNRTLKMGWRVLSYLRQVNALHSLSFLIDKRVVI
jgi:hypothetical protein